MQGKAEQSRVSRARWVEPGAPGQVRSKRRRAARGGDNQRIAPWMEGKRNAQAYDEGKAECALDSKLHGRNSVGGTEQRLQAR